MSCSLIQGNLYSQPALMDLKVERPNSTEEIERERLQVIHTINLKFLAHAWGLKTTGSLQTRERYEFLQMIPPLERLKEIFEKFLSEQTDQSDFFAPESIKDSLKGFFENLAINQEADLRSSTDVLSDILGSCGVVLCGVLKKHIRTILFKDRYIAFCDRGIELKSIVIYERDLTESDELMIECIDKIRSKESPFFTPEAVQTLNLKKVKTLKQKSPFVANCAWTGPKTALRAFLYLLALEHPDEVIKQDAEEASRHAYKHFTSFSRLYNLKCYLENTPGEEVDQAALRSIKEKIVLQSVRNQWNEQQRVNLWNANELLNSHQRESGNLSVRFGALEYIAPSPRTEELYRKAHDKSSIIEPLFTMTWYTEVLSVGSVVK